MMGFLMEEPTFLDELEEADYTGPSGAGLTNASILNFTCSQMVVTLTIIYMLAVLVLVQHAAQL